MNLFGYSEVTLWGYVGLIFFLLKFLSVGQKVVLQNRMRFSSFKNKLRKDLWKLVTNGSNELKFGKRLVLMEINMAGAKF